MVSTALPGFEDVERKIATTPKGHGAKKQNSALSPAAEQAPSPIPGRVVIFGSMRFPAPMEALQLKAALQVSQHDI